MGEGVIWKPIPDMRGYEAGSDGKIRSIDVRSAATGKTWSHISA